MGLFSKKLNPAQEAELEESATILHMVNQKYETAFVDVLTNTRELVSICDQALKEDRDLSPTEFLLTSTVEGSGIHKVVVHNRIVPEQAIDLATLITKNSIALKTFFGILKDLHAQTSSINPSKWYPKKHKKALNSWDLYFNSLMQSIDTALGVLQSPEPLKHDPQNGKDKLNLYVYALNSIAQSDRLFRAFLLPPDL